MRIIFFCFLFILVYISAFTQVKIVILGSSTAAGCCTGNPWVIKYTSYIKSINPANEVVNLAVGGQTTWHIMPTGYINPSGFPNPNPQSNISAAIAQNPTAIIINLPSNDPGYQQEATATMSNYRVIVNYANSYNVPVWITTSGPRGGQDANFWRRLTDIRDSTLKTYGKKAIDVWTTLTDEANYNIAAQYAYGDNVHYNQAGHDLIFERVKAANVLNLIPLSLQLITFQASVQNETILFHWQVTNENNVLQYVVEQSDSGKNFTSIGAVLPLHSLQANYSFTCSAFSKSDSYFRIKVVNTAGDYIYSKILKLNFVNSSSISAYPNPLIKNNFNLNVRALQAGKYRLTMINNLGQSFWNTSFNHPGGNLSMSVDLGKKIEPGSYLLQLTTGSSKIFTYKICKLL